MTIAADDTFILAIKYLSDAVMTRRSAGHFSDDDFRKSREADAESYSRTGYDLAVLGVEALARR